MSDSRTGRSETRGDDMNRYRLRSIAIAACMMLAAWTENVASQESPADAKPLDGLWAGSWGGGERGGVVFQPVIAELVVRGDQFELTGFRGANRLAGTVTMDASARRIRFVPAAP